MTTAIRPDVILEIPATFGWINANQRLHFRTKADLTRQWRQAACIYAKAAKIRPYGDLQVRIVATVHRTTGGRFDPLNWSPTAKAAIDGLVDAGLFPDDDSKHVIGPDMRAGEKRDYPMLVLRIQVAR